MRPRIDAPRLVSSTSKRKRYKIVKTSQKMISKAKRSSVFLKDNGRSIYIDSSVT